MKTFLIILTIASGVALSACNTVRGAGRDVQSAANATDNAMHGN